MLHRIAIGAATLTAAFALTGCSYEPGQSATDSTVDNVLLSADPQSQVGAYVPVEQGGKQTGVVFISSIAKNNNDLCADYSAFSSRMHFPQKTRALGLESRTRTRCLPLKVLQQQQP